MQNYSNKLAFLLLVLILSVDQSDSSILESSDFPRIVKNAYIIEFQSVFTRRFGGEQFNTFYRQLSTTKASFQARFNLTSEFFHGVSLQLRNSYSLAAVKSLNSVNQVWPVLRYSLPKVYDKSVLNLSNHINISNSTWKTVPLPTDLMTGVARLHAMGCYGKGVKIAIVDTGIDYLHPDLGGGFGPGYKVSFGYDLVGNDLNETGIPEPDDDPMEECESHGTHVAGTIGAQGSLFTGVAPEATLGMYRVFSCKGGATNDVLISAFIMAAQAKANIITASIGGSSGWSNDPWSLVVNRIANSGIICLLAAGNSGIFGPFYGSAAAGASAAIAVASVNSIGIPLLTIESHFKMNNISKSFLYKTPVGSNMTTIPTSILFAFDSNSTNSIDACSELPLRNKSSTDRTLLIKFGHCDWDVQIFHLRESGFIHVIIYGTNNYSFIAERSSVKYSIVEHSLANVWLEQLRQNQTIIINSDRFVIKNISYVEDIYVGGRISDFSSWYPMNDLSFKPDVAGPGGNILSTMPLRLGGYGVMSGTSMATPYVAGIAALYMSARGFVDKITTEEFKNVIMSTATPLNYSYNSTDHYYLAPTTKQGLGLVNASAALETTLQLNITSISLSDIDHLKNKTTFNITNIGKTTVTYQFSHTGAGTVDTFQTMEDGSYFLGSLTNLTEIYATVHLSPSIVTLKPDSTATITAEIMPPSDAETYLLPIYSGFINIHGNDGKTYRVGYMGAACSMNNFSLSSTPFSFTSLTYQYDNSNESLTLDEDEIVDFRWMRLDLIVAIMLGTNILRLDVVGTGGNMTVGGMNIVGTLPDFPINNIPKVPLPLMIVDDWNGTLSSGKSIQSGTYNLIMRSLKIFGDPNEEADYYTWRSPTFRVV